MRSLRTSSPVRACPVGSYMDLPFPLPPVLIGPFPRLRCRITHCSALSPPGRGTSSGSTRPARFARNRFSFSWLGAGTPAKSPLTAGLLWRPPQRPVGFPKVSPSPFGRLSSPPPSLRGPSFRPLRTRPRRSPVRNPQRSRRLPATSPLLWPAPSLAPCGLRKTPPASCRSSRRRKSVIDRTDPIPAPSDTGHPRCAQPSLWSPPTCSKRGPPD